MFQTILNSFQVFFSTTIFFQKIPLLSFVFAGLEEVQEVVGVLEVDGIADYQLKYFERFVWVLC